MSDIGTLGGFVWNGLTATFGISGNLILIGLLGLFLVLALLYLRGADFGLVVGALMLFMFVAVLAGLLPSFTQFIIYVIAAGIVYFVFRKFSGG